MKKIIVMIVLVAITAALLAGCAPYTCGLCGEEKTGGKNTGEIEGKTVTYCDECKESLEALADALNGLNDLN